MLFSISILSGDDLSLTAKIHLYPLMMLIIAKLNPVFPEVVSTIVAPGFKIPFSSAQLIICKAILSLDECPGLKASIFA